MKRLRFLRIYVLFLTMWAAPTLHAADDAVPKQSPVETTTTEAGDERVWAAETSTRAEHLYPSIYGQVGIFRVRSGYALPQGALAFGIGGEFYSVGQGPAIAGVPHAADTIAESLFVGYGVTEALTLALVRRNSSTTFNAPGQPRQLISSLGDFTFGASYAIELTPSLTLSPLVNLTVASNFNNLAPSGSTLSGGLGANATLGFYSMTGLPLFLHANLIYHSPHINAPGTGLLQPETFFQFTRFHNMTFGLGTELHLGDFIPFAEYTHNVPMGSQLTLFRAPSRITIGSRFTPLSNKGLALLAGFDIATGAGVVPGVPYTPPAQFVAQVSYTTGLTATERKHYYTTQDVNVVNRKFIIRKNINFKVGSAELEPSSAALLDQIAQVIRRNQVNKLLIVGHTDSSHNDAYNLKLSLDRATAVKKYLTAQGIPEGTLLAQGYGKRKPRASNATEQGRSRNRRVEFFILE